MDASLFRGNVVQSERIIYTPSPFARNNLIHLQEIGRLKALKPHTSRRENLASYLFFLVTEGNGILEYNGTCFSLKKGSCVFLDCRQPYEHRSSDDLWSLKWAHFYGPSMQGIYEKYMERGGQNIFSPASTEPYSDLLDKIYEIAASSEYIKDMLIFEKLASLLTLLMEASWNPGARKKGSDKRQNLQDVRSYLEQNFREKIVLDELADRFFINKYYLTRLFREQFGTTITNFLLQTRITYAKQLLRFSDMSIESVGRECGMPDANYFTRVFRKIEGCTPGEYRKKW